MFFKSRLFIVACVCSLLLLTSCQDAFAPEQDTSTVSQQLIKGSLGALNGGANYCDDVLNVCQLGEGDCDRSDQCAAGLICGQNNGAKFGFNSGLDVCVPSHCTNKIFDGDETGLNCGGSCGLCPLTNPYPTGHNLHCADPNFPCVWGDGNCRQDSECALGLVCGRDMGANFDLNERFDVCVPSHCTDGVVSGDETNVDCGGTCGLCSLINPNTLGSSLFCAIPWIPCQQGEGRCRTDSECAGALICAKDKGGQFGLDVSLDVCTPSHCVDRVLSGDELAIDCGGSCGLCPSSNPHAVGHHKYCDDPNFVCQLGEGDCDRSDQCAAGLICGQNNGAKFGFNSGLDVCVPSHCTNKIFDGDETGLNCGGSCGLCPLTNPYSPGHRQYCEDPNFPCQIGEGDCRMDNQCEESLVCVRDRGGQYGMESGLDVCMPTHCRDRRLSGDETRVDCGGSCGAYCATSTGVSSGTSHSCASLDDGTAKCWGDNTHGQLGDGTTTSQDRAVLVSGLLNVVRVVVGAHHSCALLDNGSVKCWGDNTHGQLGDGTFIARSAPTEVPGLTQVVDLVAGDLHMCVLLDGGDVKCWGDNQEAQLGDGTFITRNVPVAVGLTGVVTMLAAGGENSCALLDDGGVKCWGDNTYGQLGRGAFPVGIAPSSVLGLSGVSQIAVGKTSCATLDNGAVVCWGLNASGQLGDGTLLNRALPVPVLSLNEVIQVSVGDAHACALRLDGGVKCWGGNVQGQLGDGSLLMSLLPVDVSRVISATSITTGALHSCALLELGGVKCWGDNGQGQLGAGHASSSLWPLDVILY